MAGPNDPEPTLKIADGRVVELDGVAEADFDLIDEFIARRGLDLAVAGEAMALDDLAYARMLVDPGVARRDLRPAGRRHDPREAGARAVAAVAGRADVRDDEDARSAARRRSRRTSPTASTIRC